MRTCPVVCPTVAGLSTTFCVAPSDRQRLAPTLFRRFIGENNKKNIEKILMDLLGLRRTICAADIPRLPGCPREPAWAEKGKAGLICPEAHPAKAAGPPAEHATTSRREGVRVVSEARTRRIEPTLAIRGSWLRGRSKRIREKGLVCWTIPWFGGQPRAVIEVTYNRKVGPSTFTSGCSLLAGGETYNRKVGPSPRSVGAAGVGSGEPRTLRVDSNSGDMTLTWPGAGSHGDSAGWGRQNADGLVLDADGRTSTLMGGALRKRHSCGESLRS
jgi:hypothetical protein